MDNLVSNEPEKKESLKDKIPLPLNLYTGKATVDLLGNAFSKDYISGNPNLSEEAKQKNRKTTYALLIILIIITIVAVGWGYLVGF
jgi:hypothetical protein